MVGVIDCDNNYQAIYINGVPATENNAFTYNMTANNSNFHAGVNNNLEINAIIDDVRVWNRRLTSEEIAQLYADTN